MRKSVIFADCLNMILLGSKSLITLISYNTDFKALKHFYQL